MFATHSELMKEQNYQSTNDSYALHHQAIFNVKNERL